MKIVLNKNPRVLYILSNLNEKEKEINMIFYKNWHFCNLLLQHKNI